jgi:hypothetical protein
LPGDKPFCAACGIKIIRAAADTDAPISPAPTTGTGKKTQMWDIFDFEKKIIAKMGKGGYIALMIVMWFLFLPTGPGAIIMTVILVRGIWNALAMPSDTKAAV